MQCLSRCIKVLLSKAKKAMVEVFELPQAFRPITVLVQALVIMRADGIDNVTYHFIWYLGAFSFSCCCQAVEAVVL